MKNVTVEKPSSLHLFSSPNSPSDDVTITDVNKVKINIDQKIETGTKETTGHTSLIEEGKDNNQYDNNEASRVLSSYAPVITTGSWPFSVCVY